jgi:uncharacterized protein (TIGR02246 family)
MAMFSNTYRRPFALIVGLLTMILVSTSAAADCFSQSERDTVRRVHEDYRMAWLANDGAAVRRNFIDEAVLLPHHGVEPIVGMDAIKRFWWPVGGQPTTVTRFEANYDEIGGCGSIAFARGKSQVEWTVDDHGKLKRFHNAGTFLTLFRKMPDGSWKISHQMWDDPANQQQRCRR